MHVVHLGCDLMILGSTLRVLLDDYGAWDDGSDDQRLYRAWQEFKSWCRLNKWENFDSI